jgi:hypothetical protein
MGESRTIEQRLSLEHYRRENAKLRKALADLMRHCPQCKAEAREALRQMVLKCQLESR